MWLAEGIQHVVFWQAGLTPTHKLCTQPSTGQHASMRLIRSHLLSASFAVALPAI